MKNIRPKVKVINAGLSDSTRIAKINVCADGTSLYGMVGVTIPVNLYSLSDYMISEEIEEVDLIKINIEGDEYQLLNHMIDTGLVHLFKYIQIQYHSFIPDSVRLRNEITEKLKLTHHVQWCYDFIWESWERK